MPETTYSKRSAYGRLSLFYIAFFAVYGISIPLWPRWLEHHVSLEYVGLVLGAAYWAKLIVVPLTSWIADVTGNRKIILICLAAVVIFGLALLGLVEQWWFYVIIWGVAGATLSSGVPLSDGLTLRAHQSLGLDFGRARLWGSLSFIVFSVAVGWAADHYGINAIYTAILLTAGFLLVASLLLPGIHTPTEKGKSPFFKPLALPNFPLFLITVALLLSTHAGLYGFSAIHWSQLGFSNAEITLFWVIGVVAEIGMFAISGRLLERFGAMPMIILCALGGMLRWAMLGFLTSAVLIACAQVLHAFTFALLYMSFIAYIGKRVPPAIAASAQGLYDSLGTGIFFGVFTIIAGWLYEHMGGAYCFYAMSAISGGGFVLACILRTRVRRYERTQGATEITTN